MKFRFMLSFFLLIIFCQLSFADVSRDLIRPRVKWIRRMDNLKKIPDLYLKQAVMITEEDMVVGQEPIKNYVATHQNLFTSFSSTKSIKIFQHSEHKVLDLGYIVIENEKRNPLDSMLYVIAWRNVGGDWLRELDMIFPADHVRPMDDEFASLRSKWVQYANSGDPQTMASTLFRNDAVYVNNAEISRGQEDITKRFEFMKNSAFHIDLKSEYIMRVDDVRAIDIGNWITADFVGYYLIFWNKDSDGEWKISLYFNF